MSQIITPWISDSEWLYVSGLVQSLEAEKLAQAEEIITAWQHRITRLPTGVETTQCLLQAALAWCQNPDDKSLPLTISASIIRFLNLTSHVGLNEFGFRKIDEVAKLFKIPARIVQLRHNTTHGEMKSRESLIEGLAIALKWIIKNYWVYEEEHLNASSEIQEDTPDPIETFHSRTVQAWLECFQYIKIYSLWGKDSLKEMKNNSDTYDHIAGLWNQLGLPTKSSKTKKSKRPKSLINDFIEEGQNIESIESLCFRDALSIILGKVTSWLSPKYEKSVNEILVKVLVNESLLLPDKDFVEGLLEENEKIEKIKRTQKLPKLLLKSWSGILKILESGGLLSYLLLALHNYCGDPSKDTFSRDLSSAWICEILGAMQSSESIQTNGNKKFKPNSIFAKKVNNEFRLNGNNNWKTDETLQSALSEIILNPNEKTLDYVSLVFKLKEPQLEKQDEKNLLDLMDVFLGKKKVDESEKSKKVDVDLKTIDCLVDVDIPKDEKAKWREIKSIDWTDVPIGVCPGQTCETFQAKLSSISKPIEYDFVKSKLTFMDDCTFQVEAIDWSNIFSSNQPGMFEKNESSVPAFYRTK